MRLIRGCLLAVAIFGCLANAQIGKPLSPPLQRPTSQNPSLPTSSQTPNRPTPQDPKVLPIFATSQKPASQNPSLPPTSQAPHRPTFQDPKPPFPLLTKRPLDTQKHQKPSDPKKPGDIWPPDPLICDVESNAKIACGPAGISSEDCAKINCCHDGRMCYYGKYVTLQCTMDGQFVVVIHRDATLPPITSESIRLYEDCDPVESTSSFLIYQFTVASCGTTRRDESNAVVYENRMHCPIDISVGDKGSITRDTTFDLLLECRYLGSSIEALIVEILPRPPPPPVAGLGPMHVGLFLGSGHCTMKGCNEDDVAFNSYYSDLDYPIAKVLRDPVYVDVQILERSDPILVLTLGRCWVTADPLPYSYPQWDLIIDGCPNPDDRYLTRMLGTSQLPFPGHYKRFVFYMFTFMTSKASDPTQQKVIGQVQSDSPVPVPSKDLMYIHCETSICIPSLGNNCEPICYIKGRKKRQIVSPTMKKHKTGTFTVSSKGIRIAPA